MWIQLSSLKQPFPKFGKIWDSYPSRFVGRNQPNVPDPLALVLSVQHLVAEPVPVLQKMIPVPVRTLNVNFEQFFIFLKKSELLMSCLVFF
jgi:hypothetical protein